MTTNNTTTTNDTPTTITNDYMWEKASENTPITREEMDRWEYMGQMCR